MATRIVVGNLRDWGVTEWVPGSLRTWADMSEEERAELRLLYSGRVRSPRAKKKFRRADVVPPPPPSEPKPHARLATRPCVCLDDPETGGEREFPSTVAAEVHYDIQHVHEICEGKRPHTKGLRFRWKES